MLAPICHITYRCGDPNEREKRKCSTLTSGEILSKLSLLLLELQVTFFMELEVSLWLTKLSNKKFL